MPNNEGHVYTGEHGSKYFQKSGDSDRGAIKHFKKKGELMNNVKMTSKSLALARKKYISSNK